MCETSPQDPLKPTEAAFFDWYQATVPASPEAIQAAFLSQFSGEFEPARPINGYAHAVKHSALSFTVFWGGHNPHPNIKATSGDAIPVSDWLRAAFPSHKVSRADVALDFSFDGSFDAIRAIIEPIARKARVSVRFLGDDAENDPAFPMDERRGRTLYLGSQSSEVRIRLYEKGFERRGAGVENIDPNHVRLEVVIAPQKTRKILASRLAPFEMIGLSKWISTAVQQVCSERPHLIPKPPARDTTPDERLAGCVRQYGRTLREVIEEKGWDKAMAALSALLFDHGHPKRYVPITRENRPPTPEGAAPFPIFPWGD